MATAVFTSFGQWLDDSQNALSGGKVYIYDAGTTTPKSVYSDTALTVSAANPIVLDSAGRHDVRYVSTGSYKVVVKTSADVTVFTRDNVDGGVPVGTGALAIANGGTGATSAGAALSALGGATAAELADVSAEVASLSGQLASSEKTHIATGTTAQRPGTPSDGDIRRNTTVPQYEGYNGTAADWKKFMMDSDIASQAEAVALTSNTVLMTPLRSKQANPFCSAYLYCRDQQTSGTNGNTFTKDVFTKRAIGNNTAVVNNISGASLASDVITLPAGTYYVEGSAPGYKCDNHVTKLRNTTDAADLLIGTAERSESSVGTQTRSYIRGWFTITAQKTVEFQHRCSTTRTTDGLGVAATFGVSEVYAEIAIWKTA